jgi:hypothetical protein
MHETISANNDPFAAPHESAFGPKRTSATAPHMSAFGGIADMTFGANISACDPKRT